MGEHIGFRVPHTTMTSYDFHLFWHFIPFYCRTIWIGRVGYDTFSLTVYYGGKKMDRDHFLMFLNIFGRTWPMKKLCLVSATFICICSENNWLESSSFSVTLYWGNSHSCTYWCCRQGKVKLGMPLLSVSKELSAFFFVGIQWRKQNNSSKSLGRLWCFQFTP